MEVKDAIQCTFPVIPSRFVHFVVSLCRFIELRVAQQPPNHGLLDAV